MLARMEVVVTTEPKVPPTVSVSELAGNAADTTATSLQFLAWLRKQIYEFVDKDEIRKDRSAVREMHQEQARALRVATDWQQRKGQLDLIDQESQIKARLVLSLQRMKDMFLDLRREDPEMMKGVTFPQFLGWCREFLAGATAPDAGLLLGSSSDENATSPP